MNRLSWLLAGVILATPALAQRKATSIAPITPTAAFQGHGSSIKINSACRGLTMATVASNPDCAARMAKGETSTVLVVGAISVADARTHEEAMAGLEAVERAVQAEDHPAAHYLLGNLLATGEKLPPDYPRARTHLEKAVAGGNSAAADLLGTLKLAGKGGPKDVPGAAALYEQAAAGGMAGSALRLALLYLTGTHIAQDEARAREIITAANAAGDSRTGQLAMLLDGASKQTNYQLYPRPSGPAEVKAHGPFDNPAIPPAFGFDERFQTLYYSAFSDYAAISRLEREQTTLPTPYLFELARRVAPADPAKGRSYLILAAMRMAYDSGRCADPQSGEALSAWVRLTAPDLGFVLFGVSPEERQAAIDDASKREATMPADNLPWWVCHAGPAAYSNLDAPFETRLKSRSEWPAIRAQAKDQVAAAFSKPATVTPTGSP